MTLMGVKEPQISPRRLAMAILVGAVLVGPAVTILHDVGETQASPSPIDRPYVYEVSAPAQDADIFLSRPSRQGRQLGESGANEYSPRLSFDGQQVVFARLVDGDADLFVVGADGSNVRSLTSGPDIDAGPSWSRDGKWIAFSRDDGSGLPEIHLISADGLFRRQLTSNAYLDVQPAWTPDGAALAFTRNTGGETNIIVFDIVSGAETQLTSGGGFHQPTWSPDGSEIAALLSTGDGTAQDIVRIDVRSRTVTSLKSSVGALVTSLGWWPEGVIVSATGEDMAELTTFLIDPSNGRTLWSGAVEGLPRW